MIFMLIIGVNANSTKILFPDELEENLLYLNSILFVILITGMISITLFFVQRNNTEEEYEQYDEHIIKPYSDKLFDNVIEDAKKQRFSCCSMKMFSKWLDAFSVLLDYPFEFYIFFWSVSAQSEDPIWNTLGLLFCFLPGWSGILTSTFMEINTVSHGS